MTDENEPNRITRYWGHDHEMYVRRTEGGYDLAVKTPDGDWEGDTVTENWSPNKMFYNNSEVVSRDKWPL